MAGGSEETSDLDLPPGVSIAPDALRIQYARSGGPGGQNVNKVNTKTELWVPLDAIYGLDDAAMTRLRTLAGRRITKSNELHLIAQTSRTQEGNRTAAMERLRELLAEALRAPKARRRTRPSKSSRHRRLESKKRRSEVKETRRFHNDE